MRLEIELWQVRHVTDEDCFRVERGMVRGFERLDHKFSTEGAAIVVAETLNGELRRTLRAVYKQMMDRYLPDRYLP
ncbi:MAG: hypothetical protein ABJG86_11260 [Nitratireductor sp.]